jgi:hypothetical protein
MVCGRCGGTIAQVSGKSGGYYGCLAATKGACENKTLVRRRLAENLILEAVIERISETDQIAYVLERVEEEIGKLRSDIPDTLKLKETELSAEQRRLANFVDFIGEGRGSEALAKALVETERRVDALAAEVDRLRRSREKVFRTPAVEWIKDRLSNLHDVLEQRIARSAQVLRNLLGPIRMELVTPNIGRPFYRAVTTLDALALIETPPDNAEGGSNSLQRWDSFQMPPDVRSRPVRRDVCTAARRLVYAALHVRPGGDQRRARARFICVGRWQPVPTCTWHAARVKRHRKMSLGRHRKMSVGGRGLGFERAGLSVGVV